MDLDDDDDDDDDEDDVRLFFLSKMFLFNLSQFIPDNDINISNVAKRMCPCLPVVNTRKVTLTKSNVFFLYHNNRKCTIIGNAQKLI